ncbi:hypothetical protein CSAL01_02594 [Colletotrichum salicis]|uniref:Uncharacterized protein n=1 Tax=Colletotrichum salicis TaxID=1209931 RepID=A0A135V423_9PEZI|nr:hypothetical protein CSAL01_02594 [Colletotrichum salicis]
MTSAHHCGGGDNGAAIPTTAGLPMQPTCPNKEVETSATEPPTTETHATGELSHQDPRHGRLNAFINDYNRLDDFYSNGGPHESRESPGTTAHEQARAKTTSEKSERLEESVSSAGSSTVQTGPIFDDQVSISDTIASPLSEDPPLGPLQEGLQEPCNTDGDYSDDFSEDDFEQDEERSVEDEYHSLESSIRRVLAASPEHADVLVDVLQCRLRNFIPRSHDSLKVSTLLTRIFCTLGHYEKYEAVDGEGFSTGNRSTSNHRAGTQSSATPAGASIPTHLSPPLRSKRDRDGDEDEDKKKKLPPAKRARDDEPDKDKHWLCPYFVRYRNLAVGACRTPTTFTSLSYLKSHLYKSHFSSSGDEDRTKSPELCMNDQNWDAIEKVAIEANKKRPKKGTEASFQKHLGTFREIWCILFPDNGPGPNSPFCEDYEDFIPEEVGACEYHKDFNTKEFGSLSSSISDFEAQQAVERGEVSSPTEFATRNKFGEMMNKIFAIVADYEPEVKAEFYNLFFSTTTGMIGGQRVGLQDVSVEEEPGLSRTAADAREPGSSHLSQLTVNLSVPGGGNSSHPGFSSTVSHETLVQPDSATTDSNGGNKFCDQEPQETDPLHIRREVSQPLGNYHPQEAHTGALPSQENKSSLVQKSAASSLDPMTETSMAYDYSFDYDEWQREDSASTLIDWALYSLAHSNETIEES